MRDFGGVFFSEPAMGLPLLKELLMMLLLFDNGILRPETGLLCLLVDLTGVRMILSSFSENDTFSLLI